MNRPEACGPRADQTVRHVRQYESDEMVSPPLIVRSERNATRLMLFLTK